MKYTQTHAWPNQAGFLYTGDNQLTILSPSDGQECNFVKVKMFGQPKPYTATNSEGVEEASFNAIHYAYSLDLNDYNYMDYDMFRIDARCVDQSGGTNVLKTQSLLIDHTATSTMDIQFANNTLPIYTMLLVSWILVFALVYTVMKSYLDKK